MNGFVNLPIRRKVGLVILLSSTIALLLASAAFVAYDVVTFRREIAHKVTTLADILGENSAAALNFDDAATATETLAALKTQPNIVAGAVYDKNGRGFARYLRSDATDEIAPKPGEDGHQFSAERLVLFRPIMSGGKRIGTIGLRSDLEQLNLRLRSYAGIVVVVLLGSLLATVVVSARLQRMISGPIHSLADAVRRIAAEKNYSVRAEKQSTDEIGQLTDGFNEMLAQIEQQNAELQRAHDELEARVEQRTAELAKANEGLQAEIGERKRAQQDLEREQFLLRALMDNVPDCIYFKDIQSRFLRNNRAHLKRFNLTDPAEAMGKTDFDFFGTEHAQQALDDEQRIIQTGQPVKLEEAETWPDGSVTWALSTKLPLRDESGQIIGTFGISHDITERKLAEQEVHRAREAAEGANRAKSEFLANMSHELRTPLNSVIGFANILLKNKAANLKPNDITFLERILSNGKHLLGLINQILDLSKVEARKIELEWSPVSLTAMVPDVLAQFESQVRGRDIKLVGEVPPDLSPVRADEVRLKQIIINLVGNALKFTEKGSVTLRVEADPVTRQPRRIDVTDTGIGIPADKLDKVFEAFQQADTTTERKYGGTGLGLTISRALCQLMGFNLTVQSAPGQGTTFSIHISPATREMPAPAAPPVPAVPVPAVPTAAPPKPLAEVIKPHHKLVMVIDDELEARLLMTHLLEECGCRVITAESGEAALRRAREVHPDLIVLDLMMPEMNGWQVMDALKADPAISAIPVVVASVVASENRGTLLGTLDVLQKPVLHDDIQRVLYRLPHAKVLIVDDNESDRLLMKTTLETDGVEVQTAIHGQEALEVLVRFTPDLVVLDLMMPVMDGFTFLELLRKEPRHEHLPVVIVSGKDLSAEERKRVNSHAQAILKKADDFATDLKRLMES